MKVKIKKLKPNAKIPVYKNPGDAGMDLTAVSRELKQAENGTEYIEYSTGLAFEIPKGHVGLLFPRSSVSNLDISLANSVGVIDSGYRGEVSFRFKSNCEYEKAAIHKDVLVCDEGPDKCIQHIYNVGDRVGQIIILPYPEVEFEETEELTDTKRGEGGYGSTGQG